MLEHLLSGFNMAGLAHELQVYPLMAAMGFVASLCIFQLTRNVFMNPDVRLELQADALLCNTVIPPFSSSWSVSTGGICRINKTHRGTAVLDNEEEGKKYVEHGLRKFLRTRPPEIMPTINRFFSKHE